MAVTYLLTYLPTYLLIYLPTDLLTYVPTYLCYRFALVAVGHNALWTMALYMYMHAHM